MKDKAKKRLKMRSRWPGLSIDRVLASNDRRQFVLPLVLLFIVLVVTTIVWLFANGSAFVLADPDRFVATDSYRPENILDAAYFYLFGSGGQNLYPDKHVVGIVMTTFGLVLVAIVTSSITNYFDKRAQGYLSGETAYRLKNHIVILGASDVAYSIITQYSRDKNNWFLIQTGKDVEKTRREFYGFLENGIDDKRIVFIYGDRTSKDDLKRLSLSHAKEVFVIGDSDESDTIESYRDAYNMDCVSTIVEALSDRKNERKISKKGPIPCHVLFEYQTTFSVFQFTDLLPSVRETIEFRPFNFYDMWAQKVLIKGKAGFKKQVKRESNEWIDKVSDRVIAWRKREGKYRRGIKFIKDLKNEKIKKLARRLKIRIRGWVKARIKTIFRSREKARGRNDYMYRYLPLDTYPKAEGKHIDYESEKTVHLIIVGMTKMGVSLAVQAAHLCHFPNFLRDRSKKTRITFIDKNAVEEQDFFKGRFRELMRLSEIRYVNADEKDAFKAEWLVNGTKPSPENSWLDIRWEFINGRVEQPEVQDFIRQSTEDKNSIVTLAICLPKSHQSIAAALYLPEIVYENCLQILTYQRLSGYIVHSIASPENTWIKGGNARYRKMHPFGMIEFGFDAKLDDDTAARMVSHVYPEHDFMFLDYQEDDFKKDKWRKEIISNRWSSQFFANSIRVKLQSAGCSWDDDEEVIRQKLEAQIDKLKVVEHNRWNMEKLLTGFRPLAKAEEAELDSLKGDARTKRAKDLKFGPNKAHWDLRSYERVKDIDPDTFEADHDSALIRAIPKIVTQLKENEDAEKKKKGCRLFHRAHSG